MLRQLYLEEHRILQNSTYHQKTLYRSDSAKILQKDGLAHVHSTNCPQTPMDLRGTDNGSPVLLFLVISKQGQITSHPCYSSQTHTHSLPIKDRKNASLAHPGPVSVGVICVAAAAVCSMTMQPGLAFKPLNHLNKAHTSLNIFHSWRR